MTRYFKIRIGYGQGDDHFVRINDDELETAYFIFMNPENGRAIFRDGPVRGKDIISIDEDWHRAMGWNYDHQMGPDDWDQIGQTIRARYAGYKNLVKEKIQHLIRIGRPELIGKNADIEAFRIGRPITIHGAAELAAAKSINQLT